MKIMVIGNPQAILGFSLVGVQGRVATTETEINAALDRAFTSSDVGIILMTEDAARMIGDKMDYLRLHSSVPLVVEIPNPGSTHSNQPTIHEIVFRAIGVKI